MGCFRNFSYHFICDVSHSLHNWKVMESKENVLHLQNGLRIYLVIEVRLLDLKSIETLGVFGDGLFRWQEGSV